VIRLKNAVLVRPELLEFGFEKLRFLVCNRLFVEDEDVGDVVGVNLDRR
jgi:hypothetical protein